MSIDDQAIGLAKILNGKILDVVSNKSSLGKRTTKSCSIILEFLSNGKAYG